MARVFRRIDVFAPTAVESDRFFIGNVDKTDRKERLRLAEPCHSLVTQQTSHLDKSSDDIVNFLIFDGLKNYFVSSQMRISEDKSTKKI
jgi:hypothetical protein